MNKKQIKSKTYISKTYTRNKTLNIQIKLKTCLPLKVLWEIKDSWDCVATQSFMISHLFEAILLKMIRAQHRVPSWPPVLPSHPPKPFSHPQAVC